MSEETVQLKYLVRKGHFNWANPSEEMTNIHLALVRGEEKIAVINLHLSSDDYEYWNGAFDNDAIGATEETIKDYEKRIWNTHKDKRTKFKKLFRKHINEIVINHHKIQLEQLNKKIAHLTESRTELEKYLANAIKYPYTEDDALPFPEVTVTDRSE